MSLIVEKEVDAKEMAKAVRVMMSSSYLYWYLRIAGVFFIILAYLPNQNIGNSFLITGCVILAISIILPYLLYLLNKKGTMKQLNGSKIAFKYEFNHKSITVKSHYDNKNGKQTIPLETIKSLKPYKQGIIVRLLSKKTIILYANVEDQNKILSWFNNHKEDEK